MTGQRLREAHWNFIAPSGALLLHPRQGAPPQRTQSERASLLAPPSGLLQPFTLARRLPRARPAAPCSGVRALRRWPYQR